MGKMAELGGREIEAGSMGVCGCGLEPLIQPSAPKKRGCRADIPFPHTIISLDSKLPRVPQPRHPEADASNLTQIDLLRVHQ
jgi:hypothetical protein